MKKILYVLAVVCVHLSASAQISLAKPSITAGNLDCENVFAPSIASTVCENPFSKAWDKRFGGSGSEGLESILNISDGGYLLGGSSRSAANGDKSQESQGDFDYWVVKIDANGSKIWDKRFGGTDGDILKAMIATPDGGYLLGGDSGSGANGDKSQALWGIQDYWIVKIDANGNKIWDKRFGGNSWDNLYSMITTADGGYLLGGYSSSGANGDKSQASKGEADFWLIKIDANGNKIWDKSFGGNRDDILSVILLTTDNGYLLGGLSTSDITGDKTAPPRGNNDFWIVKIDANGNKIWDKCYGGTGNEGVVAMLNTHDGGYLLGGSTDSEASGDISQAKSGLSDYWILKIDASGNKNWDQRFSYSLISYLRSMLNTSDGGYLIGGNTRAYGGGEDFFLIKINAEGRGWYKIFGTNDIDVLNTMINTPDGGYLLGGYSTSGVNGDKSESSRGAEDYWIIKTVPCPTITITCPNQSIYLTATGCSGTVTWSNGATGSSVAINSAGTYTAFCNSGSCTSGASNSLVINTVPTTLSISGTANSGVYKATEHLISNQNVPMTTNVTYNAGNSIVLQGTFQAETNSVFKAEIKTCTN